MSKTIKPGTEVDIDVALAQAAQADREEEVGEEANTSVDDFLKNLPNPSSTLQFKIAGTTFKFELPDTSFEALIEMNEKAAVFAEVFKDGGSKTIGDFKKYKVSEDLAREISLMSQCAVSPTWKPLDFMKVAKESGLTFGAIRREFSQWYTDSLSYDVGAEVLAEKKD